MENVLNVLRSAIDSAPLGPGPSSVDELGPEHLIVPDGFARALGVPAKPSDDWSPPHLADQSPGGDH